MGMESHFASKWLLWHETAFKEILLCFIFFFPERIQTLFINVLISIYSIIKRENNMCVHLYVIYYVKGIMCVHIDILLVLSRL